MIIDMKKIKEIKTKIDNNKFLRFLGGFIKTVIWIFLAIVLFVILLQRFTNNNITLGGLRIFNIVSGSMEPDYDIGDVIVVKNVRPEKIKVGDNVTYLGTKGQIQGLIVTHQVIERRVEDGKYYFTTQGVNNEYKDPEISYEQLYGKVIYRTIVFSFISKAMTNIYMYFAIFLVVGGYTSYQIVKIVYKDDEDEEEESEDNKDSKEKESEEESKEVKEDDKEKKDSKKEDTLDNKEGEDTGDRQ